MRNTVVILNEELCSMSLAFEKAGFNVVATYEIDSKAYKISKENLGERVANKDILDMNICDVPEADVIAGKLDISSRAKSDDYKNNKKMAYMHVYQEIISLKQPRCFLFEVNKTSLNSAELSRMINELKYFGYKINYNEYDVNELTGFPVDENKLYVVGMKRDVQGDFYLLEDYHSSPSVLDDFLENADIQNWHYDIEYRQIEMNNDNLIMKSCFLCWKNHRYVMCDRVSWNTIKIPLVYHNHEVRQITHREVARLKGYPEKFKFDVSNKSWLYKKLMKASNVFLIYQIAKSIQYKINSDTVLYQQENRALHFEELVGNYLERKFGGFFDVAKENNWYDFQVRNSNLQYYFDVKIYTNKFAQSAKILEVCNRLSKMKNNSQGKYILLVGNVVKDDIIQKCEYEYGIYVWDIRNILFLFEEYQDIKNDFIALLNYTIGGLDSINPGLELLTKAFPQNSKKHINELREQLKMVMPGEDEFSDYEDVCVKILKELFSENLTLWKKQVKSNQDLYRFDLCCKIKHGEDSEFFQTIKNYFNTKYIIFEFKNYKNKITQREVYTTEKYLYKTALRSVAIILSRKGADENAHIAARGCLRENGKLILFLSDEDIIKLIDLKTTGEKPVVEALSDMLDEMLINLEK